MIDSVIVSGALAQRPNAGGHAWVFLQYLLGFRRLGARVLFLDRLEPEMCSDAAGTRCEPKRSRGMAYLERVMDAFGLAADFAVLCNRGSQTLGASREEVVRRVRDADLLLNVMGYLEDRELLGAARRRVFLDIDPGFGQMWSDLGLADQFTGHDAFVTVGHNVGTGDCRIPPCGIDWIATDQPVVLEHWSVADGPAGAFTSVGSWRGPYAPVEHRGRTYGLRVHEFRRFLDVPRRAPAAFELALDIDAADESDRQRLHDAGWRLADPRVAARDPWAYRDYIAASKAEFGVAKNMYVDTNSGWFSDRSICYLASGKPVLAQDTGFPHPTGDGLLRFSTVDEAIAGVEAIVGDYPHHARAARELAEAHFDSDRVLSRLVDAVA